MKSSAYIFSSSTSKSLLNFSAYGILVFSPTIYFSNVFSVIGKIENWTYYELDNSEAESADDEEYSMYFSIFFYRIS